MRFGKSPRQPSMPQQPQMPMIGKPGLQGIAGTRPLNTGAGAGFGQADLAKFASLKSALYGKPMKKGGFVKSADGCASKGKTKGRFV
jgi:hypothetical protein